MGTIARSMPQLGLLVILVCCRCKCFPVVPRRAKVCRRCAGHYADHADDTLCQPRAGHLYRGAGFEIVWPQFLTLIAIAARFLPLRCCDSGRRLGQWRNTVPDTQAYRAYAVVQFIESSGFVGRIRRHAASGEDLFYDRCPSFIIRILLYTSSSTAFLLMPSLVPDSPRCDYSHTLSDCGDKRFAQIAGDIHFSDA